MGWEQKSLQIGAAAVCCAVLLRLLSGGAVQQAAKLLQREEFVAFMIYLGTGRPVHPLPEQTLPTIPETTIPPETTYPQTQPPETAAPTQPPETTVQTQPPTTVPEEQPPRFTAADAALVGLRDDARFDPDIAEALLADTGITLREGAKVLILHSHTTEAYVDTPGYRSRDADENMVSIGAAVAELLEKAGVEVIHDTSTHDYPSYNGSYDSARSSIQRLLAENPDIALILDLHRDAASDASGGQMDTSAVVDGKPSAQLMLVIGTDADGGSHPKWRQNFALGVQLHASLEKLYPGLCRDLCLRSYRYNQDLTPGALLIEVGAAGNTRQEALTAARALAQGILWLLG
jgi:stage II sporulation protein P